MDGCYHDKQDFKSDLNIEVARDGDILESGQDLKDIKCNKNPGHRDFIPFKDLTLEHLPNEHRDTEMLDKIKMMGSRVVKLVVDKMKNGRLKRELGSGCVTQFRDEYFIQTNNHVVKTDDEVKHCTVEFHYDDDSRSGVFTSKGVKLVETCPYRDFTLFHFHPVPDFLFQLELADKSQYIVIMFKNNQIETEETFLIPHSSQLNFFSRRDLNSLLIDMMFIACQDGSISYIKSSYFKFQPIPSNIRELTSIEIHIDEDDGNSRVIPGDVVQFGDDFVVDISESIFQDEVKRYRLIWNGTFFGRGTRLYFQQVKSNDISSGIDLELDLKLGFENYWKFEFHPIPRYIESTLHPKRPKYLCCIGHPHGGIKMVTFGRLLGKAQEHFDNQYRRIAQPNLDCQCKEVGCVKYSCKTCCGSSGSPVFLLFEDMDLNVDFIHFMTESVKPFKTNGEMIENINVAWTPISPSLI